MVSSVVTPLPVSGTDCGLAVALSVIVIVPLRAPVVVGVKVTLIVHVAETRKNAGQLFVSAKSPLATILVMFRVAEPLLATVTDCAGLVVPTTTLPNVTLGSDKLTVGAAPDELVEMPRKARTEAVE
jgi:hypothetical protein